MAPEQACSPVRSFISGMPLTEHKTAAFQRPPNTIAIASEVWIKAGSTVQPSLTTAGVAPFATFVIRQKDKSRSELLLAPRVIRAAASWVLDAKEDCRLGRVISC